MTWIQKNIFLNSIWKIIQSLYNNTTHKRQNDRITSVHFDKHITFELTLLFFFRIPNITNEPSWGHQRDCETCAPLDFGQPLLHSHPTQTKNPPHITYGRFVWHVCVVDVFVNRWGNTITIYVCQTQIAGKVCRFVSVCFSKNSKSAFQKIKEIITCQLRWLAMLSPHICNTITL